MWKRSQRGSKHFSCVSVDLRGTGESDKPGGVQTTEMFADDVAALMQSIRIQEAHICGIAYVEAVVRGWQVMARATNSVPEMMIQGIFPFTPELYSQRPEYIQALCDFVRSRPNQPVDAFIQQSDAAISHDAEAQLCKIRAPTQITFGRRDMVTSTRFADRLTNGIGNSELHVFEDCSHAPLYENVPAFNEKTLGFLRKHAG
jgi:3-oxoadipate enol-lactonase